jgi:hypothetical protein
MLWASSAWAFAHTYDVNEIFSNPDGTIQFVELVEADGLDGEDVFAGTTLVSDAAIFVFPISLPSPLTANTFVLIATAGFAALPGAPTPDYIFQDGFVDVTADTIKFCSSPACTPGPFTFFDSLSFVSLPTDGSTSLGPGGNALNSPTNFAGVTGSVDASPAAPVPGLSEVGVALLILSLMMIGGQIIRGTRFQRG